MADYTNFTVETDADGIALITWDMPGRSMNVFTEEAMDELDRVIDQVAGDAGIKGAVFTSGKNTFSGGADISMLHKIMTRFHEEKARDREKAVRQLFEEAGRMSWLWRKLETSGKPWVSAINGTCMGGALELSLACHGRVVADEEAVRLALPEVKIGIFPGAGGTQRVPRLTGAEEALRMMTSGQNLSPQKAKAVGLVHEVVPRHRLIEAARKMILDGLRSVQPEAVKLIRSMGGSKAEVFRRVRIPHSLPYFFSGLKIAVTLAVVGAVVGEFIGSSTGLGVTIVAASGFLRNRLLFAAILVLTLIGVALFYVVAFLERLLLPWHVTQRSEGLG